MKWVVITKYRHEQQVPEGENWFNFISEIIRPGVYCFDTRENAEKWFDAERIAWITERYSAPEIQYFENPVVVDNKINEVVS